MELNLPFASLQKLLMKFLNSHISFQKLADVVDRIAEFSDAETAHLADCSYCTGELAALEKNIGLMRHDDSADAPAAALNFAVNLFRARRGFVPSKQSATNRIAAILQMDLSALTPAFGERSSASATDERQMLFSAEDYDIDLRIRKTANEFVVRGQILGETVGNCVIELKVGESVFKAAVDELGAFELTLKLLSIDDLQISLIKSE